MPKRVFQDDEDMIFTQMDPPEWTAVSKKAKVYKTTSLGKVGLKGAKTALNKQIRKVVDGKKEKKQKDSWIQNDTFGAGSANKQYTLTPNTATLTIVNGTNVDQRIGDKVEIKKATFKGVLNPLIYDSVTNQFPAPQLVKMYFLTDKVNPTQATDPSTLGFFREGATASAMDGDANDPYKEINTEYFHLYGSRIFKVGYASYNGTGGAAGAQYKPNNDHQISNQFSIDVTKWMPKKIVWNDAGTNPTSRKLYVVCEAVNSPGPGISGQVTCGINAAIHLTYVDA